MVIGGCFEGKNKKEKRVKEQKKEKCVENMVICECVEGVRE